MKQIKSLQHNNTIRILLIPGYISLWQLLVFRNYLYIKWTEIFQVQKSSFLVEKCCIQYLKGELVEE